MVNSIAYRLIFPDKRANDEFEHLRADTDKGRSQKFSKRFNFFSRV